MDFSPGRLLLPPVEDCVSVLFFGLALLAPVPAHLSTNALSAPWAFPSSLLALMALADAHALSAPWAFSPALPARALSAEGLLRTLLLPALLRQLPFFWVHGTMGAKKQRQFRMQFASWHGRSLRPRGVGAERSSYSCSSIYCLQPFRLKARSGWPLSLSKHIMTRSGPLRQPAQRLLRWNQSHP